MRSRHLQRFLFTGTLCASLLFAQLYEHVLGDAFTPVVGTVYEGGTVIQFPGSGVLFVIPESYTGFISPGEDVFVIEKDGEPGYILIITESDMTSEHMQSLLYQFIPYENDVLLIPTEMPEMVDNRLSLSYTAGAGPEAIKGRGLGVLHHDGTGLIMFALGRAKLMEQYEQMLNEIADSVSFTP